MPETLIESEKNLERKLVRKIKQLGGLAIKLTSQYSKGEPDRMCLVPGHPPFFVEVKSTGEKPTPIQLYRHKQIRELGFKVYVVDNTEDLNKLIRGCEKG